MAAAANPWLPRSKYGPALPPIIEPSDDPEPELELGLDPDPAPNPDPSDENTFDAMAAPLCNAYLGSCR